MSEHVVVVVSVADDGVVVMFFLETSLDPSFSCGSPTTRRSWLLVSSSESSSQASRLKRGRRSGREWSEGGGEEEGRELESTSEQKEPERDVSPEELSCPGRLLVAADMLKYLLSCLTAPAMSACCCWGKFHVLSLLGLDEVASRSIRTETHAVVSPAQVCLVLGMAVDVADLVHAVGELALVAVLACAVLLERSAHLSLVPRRLLSAIVAAGGVWGGWGVGLA